MDSGKWKKDEDGTYVAEHFEGLQEGFERFEEIHHGGIRFKVGEVVVDPQQHHPRHLVPYRRIVEPELTKKFIRFTRLCRFIPVGSTDPSHCDASHRPLH